MGMGKFSKNLNGNDTDKQSHSTRPQVSSLSFIQKTGKYIRLPLTMNDPSVFEFDFTNMPASLKVNIETGEKMFEGFFSDKYNTGYWTTYSWKYTNASFFDVESSSLLFASPVDNSIFVLKHDEIARIHITSDNISEIDPMIAQGNLRKKRMGTKEENDNYVLTNSEFHFIVKDPSTGNFIRMGYLRPKEIDKNSQYPSPSIYLILNNEYNKIGETIIPEKYRGDIFFINEIGLHVLDSDKSQLDENKMVFGLFQIKKQKLDLPQNNSLG